MMKKIVKTIYTYFFNWNKIIIFNKFGKNSFIGRRTQIHKCKHGNIEIHDNVRIGNDARISLYESSNKKPELIINKKCYIGNHVTFMSADKIIIENEVLIASYVSIIGHNHGMNPEAKEGYGKQTLTAKQIRIKEKAWIGEKVSIMPGVTIGKCSIVGTGAVVTKDIPDYCIAVGNPAKVIKKYNFDKHYWQPIK